MVKQKDMFYVQYSIRAGVRMLVIKDDVVDWKVSNFRKGYTKNHNNFYDDECVFMDVSNAPEGMQGMLETFIGTGGDFKNLCLFCALGYFLLVERGNVMVYYNEEGY